MKRILVRPAVLPGKPISNEVYVKSYLPGILCACLVWFCGAAPVGAQQTPAAPAAPSAPAAPAGPAPGAGQAPEGQAGAGGDQSTPGGDQSSPDQDNGTTLMAVPELPKIPEVQMPGERGVGIGFTMWNGNAKPEFEKGSFDYQYLGNIRMEGNPRGDQGFDASVPLGLHNVIRASYFSTRASGNVYAPSELGLISQVYLQGDYLATDYHLESFKLRFDYLAWPYPVKTSRFRFKTLWQMQFMRVRIGFDAPLLPITDSLGNPLTDSNGNALSYAVEKTYQFYLPEAGIGMQYWLSRGIRVETGGTGMSIPHHQNSWEFEGSLNFRAGHLELNVGYKGYHFRTSAQQDFWVRGTAVGPFVGLHWYSDSMAK